MSFDPQDLDPAEDFSAVPTNTVKWVEGKGQWIYWKECIAVTVYEDKGEGKIHSKLSGQVKLEPGVELYFVGGQVKE